MRRWTVLFMVMAAAMLMVAGCASAAEQPSLSISCDEFMSQKHISRRVEVPAASSVGLTLCSNRGTGFQWEEARLSDGSVLEQADHQWVEPKASLPGSPGHEVWTFRALKKGTSTVSLAYSRPWQGGEKGVWTLELEVVVN